MLASMQARLNNTYYGWWVVYACLLIAILSWGLGMFGVSAYLHATHQATGLSIASLSSAITLSFLLSACSQIMVGNAIVNFGPRKVMTLGACAFAAGIATIGWINHMWQAYIGFLLLGMGWACLSTTAISTTLAPWFEKHQGRAVSTAMLGASVGGMIAVPALLFGLSHMGRTTTMMVASLICLAVMLPLARFVLKTRPQDIGLLPDGLAPAPHLTTRPPTLWTRAAAMRTWALWSVTLAFGMALCVQIGFLTHHVPLLITALGAPAAAATVTGTALTAFGGRLLLARFSDRIDLRITTVAVLTVSALSLWTMGAFPYASVMVVGSLAYGLTIGNITTLGPIVVRREFGAASFGRVYGVAATGIQLFAALGPALYGMLYDRMGSYDLALIVAGALNLAAAIIILLGARAARLLTR